eukprot:GILK01001276.1.p1 GENE.GILK01001276.1~~GILK01001276.1.p1  ORF type:complete len:253 (-),score=27.33 GILK01001276.1:133-837(-)
MADDGGNEAPRLSLLEVIQDKLQNKEPITRLFLVAKVNELGASRADVGAWVRNWLKKEQIEKDVTGLLLTLGPFCVHILESSTRNIVSYLRAIQVDKDASLEDVKVLCCTEQNPHRVFPTWASRLLSVQGASLGTELEHDTTPPADAVWTTYSNMLKIGNRISTVKQSLGSIDGLLNTLKSQVSDLLPTNEQLAIFLASPNYLTLADYLDVYDAPVHILLENELVWPVQAGLTY